MISSIRYYTVERVDVHGILYRRKVFVTSDYFKPYRKVNVYFCSFHPFSCRQGNPRTSVSIHGMWRTSVCNQIRGLQLFERCNLRVIFRFDTRAAPHWLCCTRARNHIFSRSCTHVGGSTEPAAYVFSCFRTLEINWYVNQTVWSEGDGENTHIHTPLKEREREESRSTCTGTPIQLKLRKESSWTQAKIPSSLPRLADRRPSKMVPRYRNYTLIPWKRSGALAATCTAGYR